MDGTNAAESPGAVMVSVEVAGFAPGVTEVGDKEQAASGVHPITAQESLTELPKEPFRRPTVITSVVCPPSCRVKLADAAVTEKSARLKIAATDWSAFIITLQVPRPEHAPTQPAKLDPRAEYGVRATVTAPEKSTEQVFPQLIPPGMLITVPEPFPLSESDNVNPREGG